MNRHVAFAALGLSGTLLLPACSSGGPAGHGAVRVGSVVHIGPYTEEFASPLPANPAQAGVVEGFREGQILWDKSGYAWRLVAPVREYVTGQALTHLEAAVKAGKAGDVVPAGTDRFFMTRVTAITGRNAVLATCDDGSRFKEVNPHTGKVDVSFLPLPGQEYLFGTWRMVRLGGHWAISAFSLALLPSRSAEPCQPGVAGFGPSRRPTVAGLLAGTLAALRAARSVHVGGTIRQGGKTASVNLAITRSGELSGQISLNGAVITVLSTHGHAYLKLSPAFLRIAHLPASVCSRYCGKYLESPAVRSHVVFPGVNLASLTKFLATTPTRGFKYLGAVTTGGQPAWLLQDSHGNSVFIAARGKPYVLREVAPPGGSSLNLTRWNGVRIPGPPPASQVVNLSQLTR